MSQAEYRQMKVDGSLSAYTCTPCIEASFVPGGDADIQQDHDLGISDTSAMNR